MKSGAAVSPNAVVNFIKMESQTQEVYLQL